jgi:hypothetical protein
MATKTQATKTSFTTNKPTLTHTQTVDAIARLGHKQTFLVEGDMGSGKTSMLKELVARTGMRGVYFDCTTKDLGDLFLPRIVDMGDADCVRFVPNEEFGIHFNEPIILMLDELGKNRSILNGLNRVMQERYIGSRPLPEGSIVFATTNLGTENVGDLLLPHARNRVKVIRRLKPDADEWMTWAMNNGINPALIAAVREIPQMLASFTDYEDPKENPYIYDPRDSSRVSFVTHRSLAACSEDLNNRAFLGDHVVTQTMAASIGMKAALDIMTYVNLGDTIPRFSQIIASPEVVDVPMQPGALIMSALGCLQAVQEDTFKPVFTYIQRLPMEIQALFCKQVFKMPSKQQFVIKNNAFTQYASKNFAMFQ